MFEQKILQFCDRQLKSNAGQINWSKITCRRHLD
jgi:hypothetical protein